MGPSMILGGGGVFLFSYERCTPCRVKTQHAADKSRPCLACLSLSGLNIGVPGSRLSRADICRRRLPRVDLGLSRFDFGLAVAGAGGQEGGRKYDCESYIKGKLDENLSGNEVYYTACSLLVTLKNVCSKLHCQQVLNVIPLSCKIR